MAREIFKNLPDTTTPLSASKLNGLFNGDEPMGSIVVDDIECKNTLNAEKIFDSYKTSTNLYTFSIDNFYYNSVYTTPEELGVEREIDYTFSMNIVENENNFQNICGIIAFNGSEVLYERTNNAIVTGETSFTFNLPSNTTNVELRINRYANLTTNTIKISNIQIEKGDKSTPYTPYKKFGYNSQESMGKIVVDDISSKNKFNFDAITVPNGTVDYVNKTITVRTFANGTEQTLKQLCPDLEVGRTYALSFKTTGNSNFIHLFGTSTNWMNGTTHIVTQADLDNTIVVYGNYEVDADVVISEIQIELDKVSPYTPYKNFDNNEYVLYSGSTLENITLNDNVSNYEYIEIFYYKGYEFNSTKVYDANGKRANLIISQLLSSTGIQFSTRSVLLSDNTLTNVANVSGGINIFEGDSIDVFNTIEIIINRIVGYKKKSTASTQTASTMSLRPDTTEDETTSLEEGELDG